MIAAKIEFVWLYHLFVIIEYALLCLYFSNAMETKYRRVVLMSIPLFLVFSLSLSYWLYHFKNLPGININTEGFLVGIICAYVLMNLNTKVYPTILKHPDFWICCGLLIFFGGTFFSHGLYSYLHSLDRQQALRLFSIVNKPLNIILYSCLIIGFVCAIPRRSSLPSY